VQGTRSTTDPDEHTVMAGMPSDKNAPNAIDPEATLAEQGNGSVELRPITETPGGAAARGNSGAVFISYRVKPDEPIAGAVKALLEGTIEPPPEVFVSGVGGIVPSWQTAWGQMQSAAATADAFVAVISKNSVDREWIFFEAGAAWGRRVLYAPLLVKVEAEQLANSLKAYQATPYDQESKVRELVQEIAGKVGGVLRTRAFQSRYKAFVRALADHLGERRPSAEVDREHTSDYAFELIIEGSDEAKQILDSFSPDDPDLRSEVGLLRIHFEPGLTDAQRLERLEHAPDLHHLPLGLMGFAAWEPSPHVALKYATQILETSGPPDGNAHRYNSALDRATTTLKLLGRTNEAMTLLDKALRDSRRVVRAYVALKLAPEAGGHGLGRAALAAYAGGSHATSGTLLSATREIHGTGLNALHAYVAQVADREVRSAESAHWLGLAFFEEGTESAAYRAFKRAAEGGLKLAHVSLADMFKTRAVPAAGLDLLSADLGPYEAASAKYPYSVRAELEDAVQEDDKRASALVERGRAHFAAIVAVLDHALAQRPMTLPAGQYLSDAGVTYKVDDVDPMSLIETVPDTKAEAKKTFLCWRNCPVPGIISIVGAGIYGLLKAHQDGTITTTWLAEKGDPVVVEHLSPKGPRPALLQPASIATAALPPSADVHD
jgi:hypothetical protein